MSLPSQPFHARTPIYAVFRSGHLAASRQALPGPVDMATHPAGAGGAVSGRGFAILHLEHTFSGGHAESRRRTNTWRGFHTIRLGMIRGRPGKPAEDHRCGSVATSLR
jgi:hypothetical protein